MIEIVILITWISIKLTIIFLLIYLIHRTLDRMRLLTFTNNKLNCG